MIFMQDTITLNNYDEAVKNVSGAVRGAACNVLEQTTVNLAIVTDILGTSTTLIKNNTIVITEAVSSLPIV